MKLSINRASLGHGSSSKRKTKTPRTHERQANNKVAESGNGGTRSVMDYIREFENGGTDSSSDGDDDNSDNHSTFDNSDDDTNDNESEALEIEVERIDNSDSEGIIKHRREENNESNRNGEIVEVEDSEGLEVEYEDSEVVDDIQNKTRSTYKSILEEFEDMENENRNEKPIKILMTEVDIDLKVEPSPVIKAFPKGGFEYKDTNEEIDEVNDDDDKVMNTEKKSKKLIMAMQKKRESDGSESNTNSSSQLEVSDDYLMLHRRNLDDILQNLLNDFEINITSETLKKEVDKNAIKSGLKNSKKKKSAPIKELFIEKKVVPSHSIKSKKVDKKKNNKIQKSSSFGKNKKTAQTLFRSQENGFGINVFRSILAHRNTILCFGLAVTMHYFIFSGILKLV